MAIELRAVTDDEYPEYMRTLGVGFGFQPTDENIEASRPLFEAERSVGAFDAGRMVATAGVFTMELTLPGGAPVPAGGVTAVTVMPSHRRQGVLRRMMASMFDDCTARSEPIAMLWASESVIYGRYGYGVGSLSAVFEVDRRHAGLTHPVTAPGRIRMIDKDGAAKVLPEVFDRARLRQAGAVSRNAGWWTTHLRDPEWDREGASAMFLLIYEAPGGRVDGYAAYRIRGQWTSASLPQSTAVVLEVIAVDDTAAMALWQTCLDIDLTAKTVGSVPIDEPLRWRFADPRRFELKAVKDGLWVRLLDVPAALSRRTYPVDGRMVVEVVDTVRPEVAGRYEIDASDGRATVKRSKRKADLRLGVAELGSVFMGATTATTLRRAGRIDEATTGAAARADTLFACSPAPFCSTDF